MESDASRPCEDLPAQGRDAAGGIGSAGEPVLAEGFGPAVRRAHGGMIQRAPASFQSRRGEPPGLVDFVPANVSQALTQQPANPL
jgi:hypothetical protein